MTRQSHSLTYVLVCAASLTASAVFAGPYDPVTVKVDSPRYGVRAMRHASTAYQGVLDGAANVIGATGEAAHDFARARVENQRARRQAIRNDYLAAVTWHDRRKARNDVVHADRRARATDRKEMADQLTDHPIAKVNVAAGVGQVQWPAALLVKEYATSRSSLQQAMRDGDVDTARNLAVSLRTELRSKIRDLAPRDYMNAKRFLKGLETPTVIPATMMVATN